MPGINKNYLINKKDAMKNNEQINQLTNDALNSMDDAGKASPAPYLLTRINARLGQNKESLWTKAVWLIGKPTVAFAGLATIIIVNALAIFYNSDTSDNLNSFTEQSLQANTDEFSYTVATIYDNDNP